MVTLMTQDFLAVILEQKSYNTLKVPEFGGFPPKSIAGKPAPTRSAEIPVGAWLARDPRDARPFTGQAISRNSRRRIFPTGVIGNDSRNTMCLGTLYAVKFSLQ